MNAKWIKPVAWMVALCATSPLVSLAVPVITIDDVSQRWPWNNKLDITYTITGGQDLSTSNFCKIVFTTVIEGQTYTIDGVTNVGASANSGTHTVTWTLPDGVNSTNCTMSAALYPSDTPSGDDYMVIDLNTGTVRYEGLLATQEASNGRYNTALYKATNSAEEACMVLRKVPAGGTYPTGDTANFPDANTSTTWVTDRNYYIGVFPVTQYQYKKLVPETTGNFAVAFYSQTTLTDNITEHRPAENITWDKLRNSISSGSSLPTVNSLSSGSYLQRLNCLTGNKYGFDLPTEVMLEIAARAGATTTHVCGNGYNAAYGISTSNSSYENPATGTFVVGSVAVGSKLPNNWGLYDTMGNVLEWCLDDASLVNLADARDPFTPACDPADETYGTRRRYRNGGHWEQSSTRLEFYASGRSERASNSGMKYLGFRIACIEK